MTANMEKVAPGVYRLSFGTPETITPVSTFRDRFPLKTMEDAELPPGLTDIQFSVSSRGALLEIPHAKDEDLYGFGLQLRSLCQTGKKRTLRVNSDPVLDLGDSHAPVPLYFSTAGYGVMIDTARYAVFYTGSLHPMKQKDRQRNNAEICLSEAELYRSESAASSVYAEIPVARGADVYLFAGPSMKQAVRRYNLWCGGGCLVPEWGLGLQYRIYGKADQQYLMQLAELFRRENVPCDVLGLEPGWQTHAYSCSLVWSEERFPDHAKLGDTLKNQGYHLNLWQHVYQDPSSPVYQKLEKYAGDFQVFDGLVPDLLIPEAEKILADYQRKTLAETGIDAFKLDECDSSDFQTSPWGIPECARFPSGADGEVMHSLLGVAYQTMIHGVYKTLGRRTFGNVRSSGLFASSLPFVLYSDLYDHRDFLRGLTTAGFCGMLWTPELRAAASALDYRRRLQSLVLAPQFLMNIWSMPHPPWTQLDWRKNQADELLPPEAQKELFDVTRTAVQLRMGFLPYLYNAFMRYHFDGTPPFRAFVMDDPENPAVRGVDRAWLAGENLISAPLTAGEEKITLPLPSGVWYDFFTGKPYEGTAELAESAILVRENTMLPFAAPVPHTGSEVVYELELRLYGDHPVPAELFGDDGLAEHPDRKNFGQVFPDGTLTGNLQKKYHIRGIRQIRFAETAKE